MDHMLSSLTRIFIKGTLLLMMVMALGVLTLHIWFVNNARGILKQIVKEKSQGKFKVELSQLTFDFLSNELQVRHADLSSTDSSTQPATYHVKFNKLTLHVGSFWPLLLRKNLQLDSIILHDPQIEMRQWRRDTSSIFSNTELSIPHEMGRMYHSMIDVLDAFGIRRIKINNARLTLTNKIRPVSLPVSISNIYLDLFKTPYQTVKEAGFEDRSQSIDLITTNQFISLPGGRHRLAFKNFHLQLFRKRIQLDSCTITARTTDSARSSYKIFFRKLMLTGVDFDAMYRKNLIKADSVYCENPLIQIQFDRNKTAGTTKARPDAENIIRELTGDLDLAFVGVKDAGIKIDIGGGTKRSLYNSNRDDFQMHGLRIRSDSSMPVTVDRFDMLVQDYHLYNQDSTATYSFDSIHFMNDKVRLSNFSAKTAAGRYNLHNKRDFKIRLFELTGLDWYELVFNETLIAREAYLYNPVISFTRTRLRNSGKKLNLFSSLQSLDDFMTLDKITIVNGRLDMKLSKDVFFDLQQVNFSLYSNQLLRSIDKEGIRKAVEHFSFMDGKVHVQDITAKLNNVTYRGDNLVYAEHVNLTSAGNWITADADEVYLDHFAAEDEDADLFVNGLRWKRAKIKFIVPPVSNEGTGKKRHVSLSDIAADNTQLVVVNGASVFSSFIRSFKLGSLTRTETVKVDGLSISGDHLSVKNKRLDIMAGAYEFADNAPSHFSAVKGNLFTAKDSFSISSPRIGMTADINRVIANDIHLPDINITSPVMRLVTRSVTGDSHGRKEASLPLRIDKINIAQPDVEISNFRNDSLTSIRVPFSNGTNVKATGFTLDSNGVNMDAFSFNTTAASMINKTGTKLRVEEGRLRVDLSRIHFTMQNGKPKWEGMINHFNISNRNNIFEGQKKNEFTLRQAELGNLSLSSDDMGNAEAIIQKNLSAWLTNTTGEYKDSVTTFKWYNAAFRQGKLSLDSFAYHPTPALEELLAIQAYQKDYITAHSGPVVLTGFKPDRYKKDSAIIADSMYVINPVITIFRDKQPPFRSGIIKPLPVDMIRNISSPLMINRISLKDGLLSYTERNAKSRAEGTIHLTDMQVVLENLKNRDTGQNDSLFISMNALLMDSALINLRIKQSYADSLRGFLMTLKMRPTSLLFFNPVLTPLSNIKITSGTIDSLQLTAVASNQFSIGKMNMFYRDLRIQLVKDGNPDKTSLRRKVFSFLANTFVIKRNNDGRTGLVYFERLRDRSFFNYIVRMTFSGMATSIGVKKNKKYRKEYKRQLKERGVPAVQI